MYGCFSAELPFQNWSGLSFQCRGQLGFCGKGVAADDDWPPYRVRPVLQWLLASGGLVICKLTLR